MFKIKSTTFGLLSAAAVAAMCSTVVSAAPLNGGGALSAPPYTEAGAAGLVELAQFRRGGGRGYYRGGGGRGYAYRGRRGGGGRWIGPAIGLGVAGAIIGSGIDSSRRGYASEYSYSSGGGSQQCASAFRSYDPSDGTYQPYGGGPRERCPYL